MEFAVRKAGIDDSHAIARVQTESWKTTYAGIVPAAFLASMNVDLRSERWREQFAAGRSETFVAENQAGVVGFVSGGELREPIDGHDGELYAIYLIREFQGQGIGRLFVARLATALQDRGLRRMAVWVLEKNPAVGFYRRLGGVLIGRKTIDIGGANLQEIALGIEIASVLRLSCSVH